MNSIKFFDVIVAKDFESMMNGRPEKRTIWHKVGRAWNSKTNDSMSFEIFMIPGVRYVISMKDPEQKQNENEQTTI